eukprot:13936154-Alexandrium_andersonii.AAC.1
MNLTAFFHQSIQPSIRPSARPSIRLSVRPSPQPGSGSTNHAPIAPGARSVGPGLARAAAAH